jgi:serine/threonine protein phosphatase PrpC
MLGLESAFFSNAGDKQANGEGAKDENQARKEEKPRKALKAAFTAIDSAFLDEKGEDFPTSGSCALVCFVEPGAVWAANAGDSRWTSSRNATPDWCKRCNSLCHSLTIIV